MPFQIVRNDITSMKVDAVVNAANEDLAMGGGVCGAIFRAAGAAELQRECDAIGGCGAGRAVITKGYRLPATYIIHTVGPVWRGGGNGEAGLLAGCYASSLKLAAENGCQSVAFPLISTGAYRYPREEALRIGVDAIKAFLEEHDLTVYLVVFDRESFATGAERFRSIRSYIDDHYASTNLLRRERFAVAEEQPAEELSAPSAAALSAKKRSLEEAVSRLDESFSQRLLRLIDGKNRTDVEIYKRANVDRKLFSKIRSNPAYNPSKITAIAFAVALELNLDETRDLLAKAGYALSPSSKFDVIVQYFIENGIYDIYEINQALFAFDQMLLGA